MNSVIIICKNETCKNDLCPHSMYAAPLDGTEVKLEDLFRTESCPYFAKRTEETNHDVDM